MCLCTNRYLGHLFSLSFCIDRASICSSWLLFTPFHPTPWTKESFHIQSGEFFNLHADDAALLQLFPFATCIFFHLILIIRIRFSIFDFYWRSLAIKRLLDGNKISFYMAWSSISKCLNFRSIFEVTLYVYIICIMVYSLFTKSLGSVLFDAGKPSS